MYRVNIEPAPTPTPLSLQYRVKQAELTRRTRHTDIIVKYTNYTQVSRRNLNYTETNLGQT